MTKKPATLPDTDMPTTIPDKGIKRPKTDVETTYLKKKNMDESMCQTL